MRIRLTEPLTEAARLIRFQVLNAYPHDWSYEDLSRCAILAVQDSTPRTVGYLWLHWRLDLNGTVELHACVEKGARGLWLTPSVVRLAAAFVELLGAKTVIAKSPDRRTQRALERIGFTTDGDYSVKTYHQ